MHVRSVVRMLEPVDRNAGHRLDRGHGVVAGSGHPGDGSPGGDPDRMGRRGRRRSRHDCTGVPGPWPVRRSRGRGCRRETVAPARWHAPGAFRGARRGVPLHWNRAVRSTVQSVGSDRYGRRRQPGQTGSHRVVGLPRSLTSIRTGALRLRSRSAGLCVGDVREGRSPASDSAAAVPPRGAGERPRGTMRGTGFEPADPYGTAPSTLRRWPGLATHARTCVALGRNPGTVKSPSV